MFNFVVFGKFPTTQVVCEIGSCTIHWKVQLRTGLILTDKKFCEDRALDFPLLFTLHPHPLGVRLLLPCVSPPVLSIAAPKLGSPVSVHTRLTVLATAWCCRPRLAQCCLVVGNLPSPIHVQLLEPVCKLTRWSPITVALTKPLAENNLHWLPRILLLLLLRRL